MEFYGEQVGDTQSTFCFVILTVAGCPDQQGRGPQQQRQPTYKLFQVSARGYGCLWVLGLLLKLGTSGTDLPENN